MPASPRLLDPEAILTARQAYEDSGETVKAIAAGLQITEAALRSRIARHGWRRKPVQSAGESDEPSTPRPAAQTPVPTNRRGAVGGPGRTSQRTARGRKSPIPGKGRAVKASDRVGLVRRVRSSVEREIASAQKLLVGAPAGNPDVERAARTLASLVRTLRELNALDAPPQGEDRREEEPPRDLDQLRQALAERLDRLRRERDG